MRYGYLMLFLVTMNSAMAQKSLNLIESLRIAEKNNPFYKIEKLNTSVAEAEIVSAGLRNNPSLSISTQTIPSSRYFAPNTSFLSPDNRQITYQISKVFQVGDQYKLKIASAEQGKKVVMANLNNFRWNLFSEVASGWLDVWIGTEKLRVIEKAKMNSDTLLNVNAIRLKNQVITTTEFSRTQINQEQYRLMFQNALQSLKSSRNNLALSLGIKDSLVVSSGDDWFPEILPQSYDSLLSIALKHRKDLLLSKALADKSATDLSLEKANAIPQPEAGINYSTQNRTPYLGLSVAIPIPSSNRNQGQIAKAKIIQVQAEDLILANKLQIETDLRNSLDEFKTNRNNWEKYIELNNKSEMVLKSIKISYLKGGTTILDYLEAERTWFEMQNQYFDALYNYRKSYLQLVFTCNANPFESFDSNF